MNVARHFVLSLVYIWLENVDILISSLLSVCHINSRAGQKNIVVSYNILRFFGVGR